MKYISIFFLILISQASTVYAAPELKGSPQELKGFLFPEDKTVQISANAEETAYTDIAKVNLIVKTSKTESLSPSTMNHSSAPSPSSSIAEKKLAYRLQNSNTQRKKNLRKK